MDIKHLRSFIAVAEELNFRKAAERLNMTQPPLSLQLKNLEDELGIKLLDRGRNKRISLTTAGKFFLEDARAVVKAAEKAYRDARHHAEGRTGQLRVGFTDDFLFSILPKLISDFLLQYPDVLLTYSMSISREIIRKLDSGALDLGLVCLPIQRLDPRYSVVELPPSRVVVLLPEQHRLADQESIWLDELKDEPVTLMPTETFSGFSAHLSRIYSHAQLTPTPLAFGENATMMAQVIAHGGGITLASETSVPPQWPGIRQVQLKDENPYVDMGLIYNVENTSRAIIENFKNMVLQQFSP